MIIKHTLGNDFSIIRGFNNWCNMSCCIWIESLHSEKYRDSTICIIFNLQYQAKFINMNPYIYVLSVLLLNIIPLATFFRLAQSNFEGFNGFWCFDVISRSISGTTCVFQKWRSHCPLCPPWLVGLGTVQNQCLPTSIWMIKPL